jgi:hypothetical protein
VLSLIVWALALVSAQTPRMLVLGRVVNLATMQAEATVSERPPDQELTDAAADFAVALLDDGRIEGVRLSTRVVLWSRPSRPPCGAVDLGAEVYALCNGRVLALNRGTGEARTLEGGWDAVEVMALPGGLVVVRHDSGVVVVFEGHRAAVRRSLPATLGGGHLVRTREAGVCAYGVRGERLSAGCWDGRLKPRWSVTLPFVTDPGAPSPEEELRQVGPAHLVLPDRVLSWRDGVVTREIAHAAVADQSGARVAPAAVSEALMRTLPAPNGQERIESAPRSYTVADGARAFLLVVEGAGRLAAFDTTRAQAVFVVAVPLGMLGARLEVASGFPVVRTKLAEGGTRVRVTIHEPTTGRVVYRDERPAR